MASSTSAGATIIRSASSSTTTSRYGTGSGARPPTGRTRPAATAALNASMCLNPNAARSSYRTCISATTHANASAALAGLVTIGVTRCGTPAYADSSTCLGSISTIRTCAGVARTNTDVINALTNADLPAPVAPATSRCGIAARSATTCPPSTSLPTPTTSGCVAWTAAADRSTSPRVTVSRSVFGISMPIADRPGIGARIRTSALATAYAMFLPNPVTRSTRVPSASSISYRVTAGPRQNPATRAGTENCSSTPVNAATTWSLAGVRTATGDPAANSPSAPTGPGPAGTPAGSTPRRAATCSPVSGCPHNGHPVDVDALTAHPRPQPPRQTS